MNVTSSKTHRGRGGGGKRGIRKTRITYAALFNLPVYDIWDEALSLKNNCSSLWDCWQYFVSITVELKRFRTLSSNQSSLKHSLRRKSFKLDLHESNFCAIPRHFWQNSCFCDVRFWLQIKTCHVLPNQGLGLKIVPHGTLHDDNIVLRAKIVSYNITFRGYLHGTRIILALGSS